MSRFYLPSTSASATSTPAHNFSPDRSPSDSDDDLDTLPYPAELSRNDFLAADFNPQTYLSSLVNRHQTLEDLRSDLRQRSQLLSKELLDLVNGNYEDFLSLGGDLKGGEERVESVRVGVLGVEREVQNIQRAVHGRLEVANELLREKKRLRKDVVFGRRLLELEGMIGALEDSMRITSVDWIEDDEDLLNEEEEEDEEEGESSTQIRRLSKNVEQYTLVTRFVKKAGSEHAFVQAQKSRLMELRKTLLLDLASALRHAKEAKNPDLVLRLAQLHGEIGAEAESIKLLKNNSLPDK